MRNRNISRQQHFMTLVLCLVITLFTVSVSAQSLEKGNLVGIHTVDIKLDPDVTMNQYKDVLMNKWMPEAERLFGYKTYLVKAARGVNEGSMGFIFIYESDEARNMHWNEDGTTTPLFQELNKKMEAVSLELNKLGTWSSSYTDWIVQ